MKAPGWLIYLAAMLPLWIIAAGSVDPTQLLLGGMVAIATLPLSWRLFDLGRPRDLRALIVGLTGFVRSFFILFVPDALRSSLDMARRIIQPTVPMRPGLVAIPLRFLGPLDELVVCNHITLTPGQVLVEVDPERGFIFVHCIDASDPERVRREIRALHAATVRRLYP